MPPSPLDLPWASPAARAFLDQAAQRYGGLSLDALDREVRDQLTDHEHLVDDDCVNLYAGTNAINPRAGKLLASTIGSRPSLGHPGDKYNKGMAHADRIEAIAMLLLRRVLRADFVEHRAPSGSLANLFAFMATCRPGDRILSFSDAAAGHPTHHREGAAGLYGLDVHEEPFDTRTMDVDIVGLRGAAQRLRPRLIIVAGSMCLFPYNVRAVREIADTVGARVLYDAAHMGGLIAGGHFQQPLDEGAHLMTGSTYKSFGGPPSGFVATRDAEIAEAVDRVAYPGLTANFDLARTAALAVAVMDLLEHGPAYGQACIDNARALAEALEAAGVEVFSVAGKGHTASQHVAVRASAYGGGNSACKRLEAANVLMTGIGLPGPAVPGDYNGIRIGTQEVTRRGMQPGDMRTVADFVARVLVKDEDPARVRSEVVAFRRAFAGLRYVRP